jgi:hypothetical protein
LFRAALSRRWQRWSLAGDGDKHEALRYAPRLLADLEAPGLAGIPPTVSSAKYENPVEVILGGSGLILAGVATVLRLVRDWSNQKRRGAAEADHAEAVARERHAAADIAHARAALTQWLVNEARNGRAGVPIGDLLGAITEADEEALARLSAHRVELMLPPGLDPSAASAPDAPAA